MKLPKSEWAFHKIGANELAAAWRWEIEREAGSGAAAWLTLPKQQRAHAMTLATPEDICLKPHDLSRIEIDPGFIQTREAAFMNTPLSLHLFEIDWSAGRDRLVKAFAEWLKTVPMGTWPNWKDKGGRRNQYVPWLVDLAIYRTSKAGLTCPAGGKVLQPLIQWANCSGRTSPPHWAEAKRETLARIERVKRGPFLTQLCQYPFC